MSKKERKARKSVKDMNEQELALHAALKEKKDAKKAARREAFGKIVDFVKTLTDAPVEIVDALKLVGKREKGAKVYVGGVKHNLTKELLLGFFPSGIGTTVSEDTVWANAKLGRAEMRKKILLAIKKAEPADRVWVSFDREAAQYILVGTGPEAPEGWEGYVPMDAEAEATA